MDGVTVPMGENTCKNSAGSERSRVARLALVVTALSLICILCIATAVFCLHELRSQQNIMAASIGKLQQQVTDLESRCKQLELGIPSDETVDDAFWEIPAVDTARVKGDSGSGSAETELRQEQDEDVEDEEEDTDAVPGIKKRSAGDTNDNECSGNCRRGKQGARGDRGRRGHKGDPGEQGQKGDRGDRGPAGACMCPTTTPSPDVNPVPQATTPSPQITPTSAPQQTMSVPVAHFEGDITSAVSANLSIDRFNQEFVTLDGGWIPHWRNAEWMTPELKAKFHLHQHSGNVTVAEEGVYYVYSQMLYYDPAPFMGHSVYIAGEKKFTCTECTVDKFRKFNTCYIAGLVFIPAGGKVGIKVNYENTMVSLHYDSAYFGLIKML